MNYLKKLLIAGVVGFAGLAGSSHGAQGDASFVNVTSNITTSTRWTRDKVYILTKMIFVTNNATLTIEPGTVIRGIKKGPNFSGFAREPGTLIISRTGKIVANGTPDDPITMTSIDDPNVPGGIATVPKSYRNAVGSTKTVTARNYSTTGPFQTNGFAYCEEWGGLVILGRALVTQGLGLTPGRAELNDSGLVTNDESFKGADVVEGIDALNVPNSSGAASAKLGVYGGTQDTDSSGVLRFVSVRYAGDIIGVSNELNSITMGGMGSGTVMEHVECTFNTDDGFEWFGGRCDSRFLFSLYNRDDAFDGDEGVRINGQFWTCFQGVDEISRTGFGTISGDAKTGHANNSNGGNFYNQFLEIDGPEPDNSGLLPNTTINLYNYTFVGNGRGINGTTADGEGGVRYRLGAAGALFNGLAARATLPSGFTYNNSGSGDAARNNVSTTATPYTLNVNRMSVSDFVLPTGTGNGGFSATSADNTVLAASPFGATAPHTQNGMDLRVPSVASVRDLASAAEDPTAAGNQFVPAKYRGASRDSTHLNGWSHLQYLDMLPTDHAKRPTVSLGLAGDNPVVTFSTNDYPTSALFVVERTVDGKNWLVVKMVSDDNTAPNSGTADEDTATAGTVKVTDTVTTIGGGVVARYRVIAL
jgi:hypothetical protein